MHFSSFAVSLVSFAGLALAANHQIVVGGVAGLKFTPSNITADVGDTVEFLFNSKNHTVTQSAFAAPCTLLQNHTSGAVGFDSGFVPAAANATQVPAWTLEVTVLTPIWFYCRQANHCQSGMVGAINAIATGNKSFADFQALALQQPAPTSSAAVTGGSSGLGAVATGGLSTDTAVATSTTSSSQGAATITKAGAASSFRTPGVALLLSVITATAVVVL